MSHYHKPLQQNTSNAKAQDKAHKEMSAKLDVKFNEQDLGFAVCSISMFSHMQPMKLFFVDCFSLLIG
jgi:hypothetical protein